MTAAERYQLLEEIRNAIEASGLTSYEIAKRSGVDKASLSRFLTYKSQLSAKSIQRLCPVLGVKLRSDAFVEDRGADIEDLRRQLKRMRSQAESASGLPADVRERQIRLVKALQDALERTAAAPPPRKRARKGNAKKM